MITLLRRPHKQLALHRARDREGEVGSSFVKFGRSQKLQEQAETFLRDVFAGKGWMLFSYAADGPMDHRQEHEEQKSFRQEPAVRRDIQEVSENVVGIGIHR